ncbi:MAG: phosphoglycerate mutase (2,3-diphosphoglycerate-independent) [Candidatus Heimdallarchaeota archaeon]|nr:MAG: phosphoglycerate mutase (2,3-diphosphoglycerate-independent) [Candidatus Heimdallarchaeota archaeon]
MKPQKYNTPLAQAIREAYIQGESDEDLEPIVLVDTHNHPIGRIQKNDGLIFANIRGEREVELTQALISPQFNHFNTIPLNLSMTTMIEYHPDLAVNIAFPPTSNLANTITEFLTKQNKRVLKCVESEKAIHLTYFFNGKQHKKFMHEERIIIPSHETENLAEFPEMKSSEVADATISAMRKGKFNLIVTNISPCDVMGHIEKKEIVGNAIRAVDEQLGRIVTSAIDFDYTVLITADHGVAESWLYPDGSVDTGHTSNPVPFILVSDLKTELELKDGGSLIDVAPTILDIMNLHKPQEMEGKTLLKVKLGLTSQNILLLILDGWGYNPDPYGNLFLEYGTPNMDRLKNNFPFTTLIASGAPLGMPDRTVGNSEIGHLHMGAGRRIVSDRVRIFEAIENGDFFVNPAFLETIDQVKKKKSALHILGIISFYSSHGSIKYLESLMELAKKEDLREIYVHGMLGRRGEKPEAGARYVNQLELKAWEIQTVKLVSIIGRHWALDREENWDRIKKTYDLLVHGKGKHVNQVKYHKLT